MNGFVDASIATLDKLIGLLINVVCFLSLITTFVIGKLIGSLIKTMCAADQSMTLDAINLMTEVNECPAINEEVVEHVDTTQEKSNRSNATAGANDCERSWRTKQQEKQISSSMRNVESRESKNFSVAQKEFIGQFTNEETTSTHKFMKDTSGSSISSNTPQTSGRGPRTKNARNPENRRRPVDGSPIWRHDRYDGDGTTGSPGTVERGGYDVTKKRAAATRSARPQFPRRRDPDFSVPPPPGPGPYRYGRVGGPSAAGATSIWYPSGTEPRRPGPRAQPSAEFVDKDGRRQDFDGWRRRSRHPVERRENKQPIAKAR